ncbi:LysR family substrate-binding domain-containing protein [Arthrobacter mobilis]|uniref:LysR family substrate-binding domain-containing protein n=1 Tax=Arthrobacter mobilis TaxID=2724944 RepID=UPI00197B61A8|nr:LysR family substrate-binding domain-containing protein [Arthrobacter mobilis]
MDQEQPALRSLTVGFVPGVTPGKWTRRWQERLPDIPLTVFECSEVEQLQILRDGRADMSFVRLPVDREGLDLIPLYKELPVVVAPREHDVALYDDEVPLAELAGENFLDPEEMGGARTGIEVVASGAGVMILPMSVARLYNRKDVVYKPLAGAEPTQIGLAWLSGRTDETIEEFIGIVRGRTAHSSRQPSVQQEQQRRKGGKRAGNDGAGQGAGAKAGKGQAGGPRGGSGKGRPGGSAGRKGGGRGPHRGRR